ncbi:caspase family protein [Ekhidna sp.]|uniref:caspase family protein n=1 Tax=Ekhidna sp. TaxID=2608089 RepID=UPI003BAB49CB
MAQDLLKVIEQRDTVKIGVNVNVDPFGYEIKNEFYGVDIDVAYEVADWLDVEPLLLEIEGAEFRERYLAIDSSKKKLVKGHELDLIIAIYSKRPDRKVDFTLPYFSTPKALGILTYKDPEITNLESLVDKCLKESRFNSEIKCLGYVKNTNSAKYFEEHIKYEYNVGGRDEDIQKTIWRLFRRKEIIGILEDYTILKKLANQYPAMVQLVELGINQPDSYCIGMPQGNPLLKKKLDSLIQTKFESDSLVYKSLERHMRAENNPPFINQKNTKIALIILLIGILVSFFIIRNFIKKSDETKSRLEDGFEPTNGRDWAIGKSYAWLIGNEKYGKFNQRLNYPIKNLKEFKNIIVEKYQFDRKDIELTINAKGDDILDGFVELNGRSTETKIIPFAKRLSKNDSLVIYYSGHGNFEGGIGSWQQTDERNPNKFIRNSIIKEELVELSKKIKHILLISDCCFSGALIDLSRSSINPDPEIPISNKSFPNGVIAKQLRLQILNNYQKNSVHVITSGAKEEVPDKSEFARELNKFLKYQETHPVLPGNKLFFNLYQHITQMERPLPEPQFGTLRDANHDGGQFQFFDKDKIPLNLLNHSHEKKVTEILMSFERVFFKMQDIDSQLDISSQELKNTMKRLEEKKIIRKSEYGDGRWIILNK